MQSNLHGHVVALGFHVDGLIVQYLLAAIQVLNEFGNATVVFEFGGFGFAGLRVSGALVGERDQQALVQKRQLAQALRQGVVVIFSRGENAFVRQEADGQVKLLNLTRRVRDLMQITKLLTVFESFDDENKAIAKLNS